ncbi:MAG: hypothetical protein NTX13_20380 [Acidobacteria bacterium]|jgi:hypothetical protein|nr:hypothetical protein [Acidobacteriota bacterium]
MLTATNPFAIASIKLPIAAKIAPSVSGLIIANKRSLGRNANHAPATIGTEQTSRLNNDAKLAPAKPFIIILLEIHRLQWGERSTRPIVTPSRFTISVVLSSVDQENELVNRKGVTTKT